MSASSSTTSTLVEAVPSKDDVKEVAKKSFQSLRDLAAGGAGGVCAVIVGHPFDLVKVRLQTAEKGVYTGAMDVVRKTVAREGLARVGRHSHMGVGVVRRGKRGGCIHTSVWDERAAYAGCDFVNSEYRG